MLIIDVYAPGAVRLTLGKAAPQQAEIWLDPTGGSPVTQLPKLILASGGQAMDGILAFTEALGTAPYSLIANATVTQTYPNLNAMPLGIGSSQPVELAHAPITVTMVSSACDSVLPNGQAGGLACGYIIQAAGHKIYLAGRTGVSGEMRFIGDFYKPTLAVLPLHNQQGIGLATLPRVLGWVGADMIIPWPLDPAIDADELRETVDAYSAAFCKLLKPGMSWELPEALSSGRSSGPESRY
jgi:hypothetical protein